MNFKYAGHLLRYAALAAVVLLFLSGVPVMEMQTSAAAITPERPASVTETTTDAKVESMPNPVTAYPTMEGYPLVTWETLAGYAYDIPTLAEQNSEKVRLRKKKRPIPKFITALNGTKAAIIGYLIPMETDATGEYSTQFVIVRSQMTCCFGIAPKLNEWVMVTMEKNKRVRDIMDVPTMVFGTIEVGEKFEDMKGWSLYRMVAGKTEVQHTIR